MIRAEARETLLRWREALAGTALAGLGLWWWSGPGGLLAIPGGALVLAGLALIWIGVQRARFRSAGDGVGAVQVDEGQITYFGPLTGGAVALREMDRLTLLRAPYPAHWQLEQLGQPPLMIPVNANGSDALFDAFATLPGLRTERMLSELQTSRTDSVVIWERQSSRPAHLPLH